MKLILFCLLNTYLAAADYYDYYGDYDPYYYGDNGGSGDPYNTSPEEPGYNTQNPDYNTQNPDDRYVLTTTTSSSSRATRTTSSSSRAIATTSTRVTSTLSAKTTLASRLFTTQKTTSRITTSSSTTTKKATTTPVGDDYWLKKTACYGTQKKCQSQCPPRNSTPNANKCHDACIDVYFNCMQAP